MIKFFYDGEDMREKNGFIFIETIIAIIILMASFMTLINMYTKIYHKLDNRIRYDNINLIYKANIIKEALDNYSNFSSVYKNLLNGNKLIINVGINTSPEKLSFSDKEKYMEILKEMKVSNVFLIKNLSSYRTTCLNNYLQDACNYISFNKGMTDYLSSIKNTSNTYALLIETRINDNGTTCYQESNDNLCSPEYTYLELYYPIGDDDE